ncbi:MAG TPA: biotin--[acetyl-CoA-carboxylase] ligase [Thermoanaerobaculia bacterium]|nr:biotin--[acetyl-CoA-carboxylase] ligase [Thermoanaerobaculia bacterium]
MTLDPRRIASGLRTIESIAVIPRVASTNLLARRILTECIANDLPLPRAILIAGEQFAGKGRNERVWSSPAGKGIYATVLITRNSADLGFVPLQMANIVASFLREVYSIDARIKWPNDVVAGGRKIAGILIEARVQDERAYMAIGVGINVEPVQDAARPNAVAITELSPRDFHGIDTATMAFIEHLDEHLALDTGRERVLDEWRRMTVHRTGERIHCVIGARTLDGTWGGIDDQGRALLHCGGETVAVSAGEIIAAATSS